MTPNQSTLPSHWVPSEDKAQQPWDTRKNSIYWDFLKTCEELGQAKDVSTAFLMSSMQMTYKQMDKVSLHIHMCWTITAEKMLRTVHFQGLVNPKQSGMFC